MPRQSESLQKKLDDVLSSQKTFSDKAGLGYTGESSSTVNIPKEVKFLKAKELMVATLIVEKENVEKRMDVADQRLVNKPSNQSVVRFEARAKSLPRSQRGPRMNHESSNMCINTLECLDPQFTN